MYPEDKQKEVPYPMSRKNPFVMPILKWVGGKRQLLDSINPLIPECSTYYEPFIGGGAVLFGRQPNKAVINDSNEELINVYRMIKEEPEALIAALSAQAAQDTSRLTASQAGVFSGQTDGYESLLIPRSAGDHHPPASSASSTASGPQPDAGAVGKLVTDATWYFVCAMGEEEAGGSSRAAPSPSASPGTGRARWT